MMGICQFLVYFPRVCDYIKYGWDIFLIDPDGGANVQNKLQATSLNGRPEDTVSMQTIPNVNDALWTKEIYRTPLALNLQIFSRT